MSAKTYATVEVLYAAQHPEFGRVNVIFDNGILAAVVRRQATGIEAMTTVELVAADTLTKLQR